MRKPEISIFGLGRLGSALQLSLTNSGYPIKSTFQKNEFPHSPEELGELIFLCVPDGEIISVYTELAQAFPSINRTIVHCSGTLSSMELRSSFPDSHFKIACFHPLKAISYEMDSFEGVWFDLEGDEEVLSVLNVIAGDFGANHFEVKPEAKALLHAAAVVSSNYLVTLMKIASDIAATGNIEEETALKILLPLADSSLQNITKEGLEDALTGPISRGDTDTVQKHIMALRDHPELYKLYKSLGLYTLSLIENLNDSVKEELKGLFKES